MTSPAFGLGLSVVSTPILVEFCKTHHKLFTKRDKSKCIAVKVVQKIETKKHMANLH